MRDDAADQVDPEVAELARCCVRANPRTSATATAMPTAAETKFCTARPAICTRWPMVDSPEYACQLVLVTKLTRGVPGQRRGHRRAKPEVQRQVALHQLEDEQEQDD